MTALKFLIQLTDLLTNIKKEYVRFRGQLTDFWSNLSSAFDKYKQVLYITIGATVESSVPLHYVHLSFSDDWFDNRK